MPITPDPLNPEQRARAEAVTVAGRIINGSSVFGSGGVKTDVSAADILTVADFILGPPSLPGILSDLFGGAVRGHVHIVPLDDLFGKDEPGDDEEGEKVDVGEPGVRPPSLPDTEPYQDNPAGWTGDGDYDNLAVKSAHPTDEPVPNPAQFPAQKQGFAPRPIRDEPQA